MNLLMALLIIAHEPSADDLCKRTIVYYEARGESVAGMKAVRQVLSNRARKNGTSVCTEAKRSGQFSSYKPGMNLTKVRVDKKFLTAYNRSGRMLAVVPRCTDSFHNRSVSPYWAQSKRKVATINNHVFYC